VWVASGHVGVFSDPLTECLSCHKRFRADVLEENFEHKKGRAPSGLEEINCPECGTLGRFTEPRDFNMMLKTYLGVIEDESGLHYLRPETAQGIFINFKNVEGTARMKVPFGIGQVGKSFRNEITPGNFIFRTREFEQMEMEFFVKPGTDEEWHQHWIDARTSWYTDLGIAEGNLRHYEHPQEKLSHYSKRTVDIEYNFGFAGGDGWGELEGIANRGDFDLRQHQRGIRTVGKWDGGDLSQVQLADEAEDWQSKGKLSYFDDEAKQRYVPYVIEPAAGADRATLAFLCDAYAEDSAPDSKGELVGLLHRRGEPGLRQLRRDPRAPQLRQLHQGAGRRQQRLPGGLPPHVPRHVLPGRHHHQRPHRPGPPREHHLGLHRLRLLLV
jgi:glycyl-tRNA synthetase